MVSRVFYRSNRIENRLFREAIMAGRTSEDSVINILVQTKNIIDKKKIAEEEKASVKPNARLIAKCDDVVSNLTNTVQSLVMRFCNDQERTAKIMESVKKGDIKAVESELVSVLRERNPEAYNKKSNIFEQYLAEQQKRKHR